MTISLILIIAAIVCWLMAGLNVRTGPISIGWMGLFLYGLSMVIRS